MPFLVVQTKEKGHLQLAAVPDLWVHSNVLFWPKKSAEKLRRQENCQPDASWETMACVVKRKSLRTFQEANDEIDAMSDGSETEADDSYVQSNRSNRKKKSVLPEKSFNDMAEALVEYRDQDQISVMPTVFQEAKDTRSNTKSSLQIQQNSGTIQSDSAVFPVSSFVAQNPQLVITEAEETLPEVSFDAQNFVLYNTDNQIQPVEDGQIQQLQHEVKSIKEDIKTIISNQNSLYEIQANMCSKLSEIQNELSSYIQITVSRKQKDVDVEVAHVIKNLRELEEFERNLTDSTFKEKIMKKFAVVCTKGLGKGGANAYYLIDSIFDRNFLKECTWTGSSKDETVKICFKAFKRTINLFFDIVHETDASFTKTDCDKFFKVILKNARKRSESSQRMSAPKVRIVKKKTTKNTVATVQTEAVHEEADNNVPAVQKEVVIVEIHANNSAASKEIVNEEIPD